MARGKRQAPPPRRPFGAWDMLFLLCGILLAFALMAVAILPAALGLTGYAISSVSMEPALRRGDILFVAPVQLEQLEPGNLLTFQVGDAVLTHRVYSVDLAAGIVRTKADAADHLDSFAVTQADVIGRPAYKLPLLGYLSLPRGEEEGGG